MGGPLPLSVWATTYTLIDREIEKNRLPEFFEPGDQIEFVSGRTYKGALKVQLKNGGDKDNRLQIKSSGEEKAIIQAGDDAPAILILNSSGIKISNLKLEASPQNKQSGLVLSADEIGSFREIELTEIEVAGFGNHGIEVRGTRLGAGFHHVFIHDVNAHHNRNSGITVHSEDRQTSSPYIGHSDVEISNARAEYNLGDPNALGHSGDGIVMSGVDGGFIKNSTGAENGSLSNAPTEGPVAIWVWNSRNVEISHCVAHHNHTAGGFDGGALDIDGSTVNCILHDNLAYDNDGAGVLVTTFVGSTGNHGAKVYGNVLRDNGRKNGYGGIEVIGDVTGAEIHDNKVFVSRSIVSKEQPAALRIRRFAGKNLSIFRNTFAARDGLRAIDQESRTGISLIDNHICHSENEFLHLLDSVTKQLHPGQNN